MFLNFYNLDKIWIKSMAWATQIVWPTFLPSMYTITQKPLQTGFTLHPPIRQSLRTKKLTTTAINQLIVLSM